MARNLKDFLDDFNMLMDRYHLHNVYFDSEKPVTPDEIREIVNGAANGKKDSLEKLSIVKEYFKHYSDMIEYDLNDRRNWEYTYPEMFEENNEGEENGEVPYSRYEEDKQKLEIMKRILNDLNNPPHELFGIMTPTEMMALTSMTNQIPTKFPEDIKRYTGEFIGKKPNGGKRKTHNKKHSNKRKRTNKRKMSKKQTAKRYRKNTR